MPWYAWCLLIGNIGLSVWALVRSRIAVGIANDAKVTVSRRFP